MITVFPINIDSNEKVIEQSKEIICPECKENILLNTKNYRINLLMQK